MPGHRRPDVKNASGPFSSPEGVMDFVDLIVGSEGIFGIVTSCILGLKGRPGDCLDIFLSRRTKTQRSSFSPICGISLQAISAASPPSNTSG